MFIKKRLKKTLKRETPKLTYYKLLETRRLEYIYKENDQ